ncbi:hypothetical protein G6F46_014558 [Rhizopus delemar]|nr:hypothetical protein G6F24_016090 [Rhizopus arrhizus]KAG1591596.1 hypothetical protein G6F46_014558 [Rhizopus delemar]
MIDKRRPPRGAAPLAGNLDRCQRGERRPRQVAQQRIPGQHPEPEHGIGQHPHQRVEHARADAGDVQQHQQQERQADDQQRVHRHRARKVEMDQRIQAARAATARAVQAGQRVQRAARQGIAGDIRIDVAQHHRGTHGQAGGDQQRRPAGESGTGG